MSATVAQLLAHPELIDLRRVAGSGNPSVTGVRGEVGSRPVNLAASAGDALVLLSMDTVAGWSFDALLRRAAESAVRVLVLGEPALVDTGSAMLAERLGVVVLACADPWLASVVIHDLLGSGVARTAGAVVAAARTGRRAGESMDELLRAISRDLARPIFLFDSFGHSLASSGTQLAAVDDGALDGLSRQQLPTRIGLPSGAVALGCPVPSGVRPSTWLVALLTDPVEAEESAVFAALDVGCIAAGHRLALLRMADERNARQRTALLGELADVSGELPAPLRRRALDAGWAVEGWHLAARVIARSEVDVIARRLEVVRALAAERLEVQVVEQTNGWALWMTWPGEPGPAAVEQAVSGLRRSQLRWEATMTTQVGVGRTRPGPAGIGASLAEASDAAVLAAGRPQTGRFLHVDRLGLAQLLLAWTRTDTFQPAAHELLAPLRDSGGDLLATLTAYLDAESSLVDTAATLGVHRNTVADRIARASRLLSIDLADPETRLALHLACRTVES